MHCAPGSPHFGGSPPPSSRGDDASPDVESFGASAYVDAQAITATAKTTDALAASLTVQGYLIA